MKVRYYDVNETKLKNIVAGDCFRKDGTLYMCCCIEFSKDFDSIINDVMDLFEDSTFVPCIHVPTGKLFIFNDCVEVERVSTVVEVYPFGGDEDDSCEEEKEFGGKNE